MSLQTDDLWTPDQNLPPAPLLQQIAERCFDLWEIPKLSKRVRIGYNPRLRSTLGRAVLNHDVVELNPRLLLDNPDQLIPTLVHELAHLAVHHRYGKVPPHGRCFRTLMCAAGFSADATHNLDVSKVRRRRRRFLYLHRCSDCGYSFIARSVRRNCYCSHCGPAMSWDIYRAPATRDGANRLKTLQNHSIC